MRNEKMAMIRQVRDDLLPAEVSFDETLGGMGKLLQTICTTRLNGDLPMYVGQEAIGHITAAAAMLGEARGRIVSAHQCFAKDRSILVPEVAWGDGTDCPSQASAEPLVPLRAVG